MYLYETIESYTADVVLAHPLKTRAIAEARIKTDTIDATTLAELLRLDGIPKAYIPPREVRDIRELLRYRASLVSIRVGIKNTKTLGCPRRPQASPSVDFVRRLCQQF